MSDIGNFKSGCELLGLSSREGCESTKSCVESISNGRSTAWRLGINETTVGSGGRHAEENNRPKLRMRCVFSYVIENQSEYVLGCLTTVAFNVPFEVDKAWIRICSWRPQSIFL